MAKSGFKKKPCLAVCINIQLSIDSSRKLTSSVSALNSWPLPVPKWTYLNYLICASVIVWLRPARKAPRSGSATPPPSGVRRRMERNRWKLVGRNKGSLTEQQTEGTVTTMIPISRIHKTKQQNAESNSHHLLPPHAPEPRLTSHCPAPPQPEPSMTAHGMEYPALFGQVGSARPAVFPPGFCWKLTLSWQNPGHYSIPLRLCIRRIRIIESWNCYSWERPLRSASPTINTTLPFLPHPKVQYLRIFWIPPGRWTQPPPWAACCKDRPRF